MADRRMFSLKIIDSDAFLDMPTDAQNLYFHLSMRADDDGFIGAPKKIMRMTHATDDSMKILLAKRFLLCFDTGIVVVKHWRLHNYIAKDRYTETIYKEEKDKIFVKANGVYTDCIQDVDGLSSQVRLGKDSLEKKEEEKSGADKPRPRACPDASCAALHLKQLHQKNIDPRYSVPDGILSGWALDIEKIQRIDGRTYDEIEEVVRWVKQPNNFWAPNIMSGKKLREKFPTLIAQMKRPAAGPAPKVAKQSSMLEMEE